MARKPSETVQVNLRIKESLRRLLENAARKHGCTLNYQMTSLLVRGLEQETTRTLDAITSDLQTMLAWRANYVKEFPVFEAATAVIATLKALKSKDPRIGAVITELEEAINNSSITAPFGARVGEPKSQGETK